MYEKTKNSEVFLFTVAFFGGFKDTIVGSLTLCDLRLDVGLV